MLYSLDGKKITVVAYEKSFKQRMKRLNVEDYRSIVEELNRVIDWGEVHTSSWIPGSDWRGTLYEPIWIACQKNDTLAAQFYGQILYQVMIDRPEKWCFGDFTHAKGKTYFKLQVQ